MKKEEVLKSLEELRKLEARKFKQSVDLIINLKNFDIKRESVNLFVSLPHKVKDIKIMGFLNNKSKIIETITKAEFEKYKNKKDVKRLVREYDFFIAQAALMPSVATIFGRYLGPAGKMPSPQIGIITNEDEPNVKEVIKKAEKMARIKTKEPSIKLCVGNEVMNDEEIAENALAVYNAVMNALPAKRENIRSVLIKFTMSKPIKIQ